MNTAVVQRSAKVSTGAAVPPEVWGELCAADTDVMPTQAAEWIRCLTAVGGYRNASRLYEMPDGRRALLPLVHRPYPGGSAVLHSMPNSWGYGGLIAPDGVTAELVGAVLDDLSATPVVRVHIRPNPLHARAWAQAAAERQGITAVPSRAHILDLEGGFERVWSDRFKGNVRTGVRRAEKEGVTVETDTTGRLVPVFYDLLLRSVDRWATQQHEPRWLARFRSRRRDPLSKFTAIAALMGEDCRISVAWFENKPVAAVVVLRGRNNAHYTRGAMDKTLAGRVRANDLLQKAAIEDACRSGCHRYHMGDSGFSESLGQFKSRFGAAPHDFAEYWIERLPVYRADRALRTGVKRVIGFQDAADDAVAGTNSTPESTISSPR